MARGHGGHEKHARAGDLRRPPQAAARPHKGWIANLLFPKHENGAEYAICPSLLRIVGSGSVWNWRAANLGRSRLFRRPEPAGKPAAGRIARPPNQNRPTTELSIGYCAYQCLSVLQNSVFGYIPLHFPASWGCGGLWGIGETAAWRAGSAHLAEGSESGGDIYSAMTVTRTKIGITPRFGS